MAKVEGVAAVNAHGAAVLYLLAVVLSSCSAFLPWWTGTSAIGLVADPRSSAASVTLWSFDMEVAVPDPQDVTSTTTQKMVATWVDVCDAADMTAQGKPMACSLVQAIQAFTFLAAIFSFFSIIMLEVGVQSMPLLLMPGAGVGGLTGLFALTGSVLGVATETNGLTGPGIMCLVAGAMLCFAGVGFTLYSATLAMKEMEGEEHRVPRQVRAEEARRKDAELSIQLESGLKKGRHESTGRRTSTMSEDVSSTGGKKAPVYLKKVLFWSKDQGADGDEIPTAMLEAAFREIDKSGDGSIDTDELVESLQLCGLNVSQTTVDVIIKEIDKNCSGDIDIHEFVEFFRSLEELSRFGAKSQQQAQFLTFICNLCFVVHIIIVSVLLMNFINLEGDERSDAYLIMKNMLIAFSAVLCILLVFVICLPAIKLTIGQNIATWQRAYEAEVKKRLKKKPTPGQASQGGVGGLRQAAWQGDNHVSPTTGHVPVNAALHGASYRTSKNAPQQQHHQREMHHYDDHRPTELTQIPADDFGEGRRMAHEALGAPQPIERYEPAAYRYAAMLAVEARQASSFSPMQVRDLDIPPDSQPMQPGMLALTGGGPF